MINILKWFSNKICNACQMRKQIKISFKNKNFIPTSKPLELLHMDLFGPFRIPTLKEKVDVYVIVDEFFRFRLGLILK